DPDWEAIACQQDSYVTGVAIGFDEPAPHLPQVYEFKFKSRKLDDSEDEWHRDNYSSAKQTVEQLEQKFKEEEALGRMAPSTLPVLEQKYGKDRVRIASLGSLLKPDGCAARFLLTIWFYHLVYVDDVHANFAGKDKFHHLLMWLACFEMFGTPFAYKKFRGGLTSAFVGYELSYPDQRVGISESRGQWLLKCVSAVARLPDTVILTLEYLSLTFKDMSFKVAAARTLRREGVAFRTDAKCADGYVVLGGWECSGTTKDSRWFSLRLTPDEAPYLFDPEGHSQWASASAELLATLAALHAFGHLEGSAQRRIMTVEVLAQTDNKANEGLAKKGSTTRWPLLMINMQLSHLLMKASLKLTLGWRPRDQNQEADALTNEVFDLFDDRRRICLQYSDLPLSFLHSLYKARLVQTSSRQADAVLDAAIGKPRFKGKRKREKSPW
ncbi:unnamed protein product, partial [Symbiodinium sp. KB8]